MCSCSRNLFNYVSIPAYWKFSDLFHFFRHFSFKHIARVRFSEYPLWLWSRQTEKVNVHLSYLLQKIPVKYSDTIGVIVPWLNCVSLPSYKKCTVYVHARRFMSIFRKIGSIIFVGIFVFVKKISHSYKFE